MSFDEEHLDDHYLCQREVAERDARIRELEEKFTAAAHDRDRWHKAFLDAKYPEMLPTRVDLEARIRELEEKLRLTEGAFKNARIRELEAQLAACKIARDGFTAASDTAHARVIELETENAALRHDLERSTANHVADINASQSDRNSDASAR